MPAFTAFLATAMGKRPKPSDNLTGDDTIIGSTFADTLHGYTGNDTIYGGGGKDVLYGDAGADLFVFDAPIGNGNLSTLKDFHVSEGDRLALDAAVFPGLTPGTLAAPQFVTTNTTRPTLSSMEAQVVYNNKTGTLYFDADGAGTTSGLVKIAVIVGKPTLQASHIEIITSLDLDLY